MMQRLVFGILAALVTCTHAVVLHIEVHDSFWEKKLSNMFEIEIFKFVNIYFQGKRYGRIARTDFEIGILYKQWIWHSAQIERWNWSPYILRMCRKISFQKWIKPNLNFVNLNRIINETTSYVLFFDKMWLRCERVSNTTFVFQNVQLRPARAYSLQF